MLRPFFTYFGAKWRLAPRYPPPLYEDVIEPFAGSAGYSLRYPHKRVFLIDKSPTIVGVWSYLLKVSSAELLALPDLPEGRTTDDLHLPQEARWLIGFWLNKGHTHPGKQPSAWARRTAFASQFWGPTIRERLARQVEHIRHWRVREGSYEDICWSRATWFIDPPYTRTGTGRRYPCSSRFIDYAALGTWCERRQGQVIVCEQVGATWLPFVPFHDAQSLSTKGRRGYSPEAVWLAYS